MLLAVAIRSEDLSGDHMYAVVSTPEGNCIGGPEQNCITTGLALR